MQRRGFLGAVGAAGAAAMGMTAEAAGAAGAAKKQYLELRLYRCDAGAMREGLETFLGKVAIPAWNRAGIKPVGVFGMTDGTSADLYVLLPHESIESFAAAPHRVWADAAYQKDGAAFLDTPKKEPPYKRIESSLMLAFDGIPKVEVPATKETRLFQLRIYESHCAERAMRKMEMFNTGGELDLFRRTGMNPVFFGQSLIGTKLPNLTYMLGFDDVAAKEVAWKTFGGHPEWKKMRSEPKYKDTVSNITNIMLRPGACSQI